MIDLIKLEPVLEKMELAPAQSKALLSEFGDLFVEAHKLVAQGKGITVTREDQVEKMKAAGDIRRKLVKIRMAAEKAKTAVKAPYLRGAQAAQDIYNDIKKITEAEEDRLKDQEKFAEILEEKRALRQQVDRVSKLSMYVDDVSVYSLKTMPEDTFSTLLAECKKTHEDKVEVRKKEEKKAIEVELSNRIFNQRQIEMAPFQEFMKNFLLEVETDEEYFQKELTTGKKAKAKYDKKQEKIREDNKKLKEKNKKAEKAKEEAERVLAEEKASQQRALEAEEKIKADKKEAQEDAERKALLAPDKEKLSNFALQIETFIPANAPAVKNKLSQEILNEAESLLNEAVSVLKTGVKKL